MILEALLPLSMLLPGLMMLDVFGVKSISQVERVILSYLTSLAAMLCILYIGGILHVFAVASYTYLVIIIVSAIYLARQKIQLLQTSTITFKARLFQLKGYQWFGIITSLGLLFVYVIVLYTRPILDSDVARLYLPFAKEIVRENSLTYTTGYDYNIFLRPIGVSVIYAWTYIIGGAVVSEPFRLMPIVAVMILILLEYEISLKVTNRQNIAILSTAIFLVLPFHDRLLFYNAFYPDVFYYPLVLTVILLLLRYSETRETRAILCIGVALGVSSLIKAQSIYILIVVVAVLAALELPSKYVSVPIVLVTPFVILIPNFLLESIQGGGILFALSGLSGVSIWLFIFLAMIAVGIYFLTVYKFEHHNMQCNTDNSRNLNFIFRVIILILPVIAIASLWYVNNYLQYGSFLYTSSINLPNYKWALEILGFTLPPSQTAGSFVYMLNFGFMFLDPAVAGYVWLIPIIGGIFFIKRNISDKVRLFIFMEIMFAIVIFSQVVYGIPALGLSAYNPRDLLPLAPVLTILCAFGINFLTTEFRRYEEKNRISLTQIFVVALFGFFSFAHSVIIWFAYQIIPTSTLPRIMEIISSCFGLSLNQTSLQLNSSMRVKFATVYISNVLLFSVIIGIPLIIIAIRVRRNTTTGFGKVSIHPPKRVRQTQYHTIAITLIMLSVIIIPRGSIYIDVGLHGVTDLALKANYGGLYGIIEDHEQYFNSTVLTFMAPDGLQYYIPDVKLIDLVYAANLAYLSNSLRAESILDVVNNLKEKGITYLLVNPTVIEELDIALNYTLTKIMSSPSLAYEIQSYGSWKMYQLGPHTLEKKIISLDNWTIDPRYTNSSYSIQINGSKLILQLYPTGIESRVTIISATIPELDLAYYDLVFVNFAGDSNARLFIRFWLDDNTNFDVAYWVSPNHTGTLLFSLDELAPSILRGDAQISLKSSDGFQTHTTIFEISFIKIR